MAYVDTKRNRTATIAVVGALHVGAIYALAVGLAGPVWQIIEDKPLVGEQIPLPKLPETIETPKPEPKARQTQADPLRDAPITHIPTTPMFDDNDRIVLPQLGGGVLDGDIAIPLPLPLPKPPAETFAPKLARPVGKPGLWVTQNDYPAADLRAEREGTTRFQLTIGADGKVQACEITVSSGHASLDAAACANLTRRARFTPATDATGAAVPGTYSSAVRWQIPKD